MGIQLFYGRVSSQEQSLETQLYLFQQSGADEAFIEKISGRSENRPELNRLVARALELRVQGEAVEILFVEFSRWGRNTGYTLAQIELLEKAGVTLRELHGSDISVQSAAGLLNTGMKALMAHYYSVELSERVKRAYDRRRGQNRPLCGNPPFGYRYTADYTALEPHPEQWPIARQIVERLLGADSKYSILQWLQKEHGIRKSRDGINKLALCEVWRGNLVDHKNGRVVYGAHTPLITESERQRIIERIELSRRLKGSNQGKIYAIPTGGLVRCAGCEYAETTSTTKGRRYFRCTQFDCQYQQKYLRQDAIEAAIQNAIVDAAESIADAILTAEAAPKIDPRVVELEAELAQLQSLSTRPGIAAAISEIEAELAQLKTAPAVIVAEAAEKRELIQGLAMLGPEDWAGLTPLERRDIYASLVDLVLVQGHDIIEIRLKP